MQAERDLNLFQPNKSEHTALLDLAWLPLSKPNCTLVLLKEDAEYK